MPTKEASQTLPINTSSVFPLEASLHKLQHSEKTNRDSLFVSVLTSSLPPAFNFLFPCDRIVNVLELLKVNQVVAIVFACKIFRTASVHPVFYQPLREIIGDTRIQHRSLRICYNVNIVLVFVIEVHSAFIEDCEMPPSSA